MISSLTILPTPNGPFTDNFNPYSPTSPGLNGALSLIYEPLLQFNLLKTNSITPWLATGYSFSNGGETLTFDIRKGVKFSDGTPMTSADVAFTFKMIVSHPAINTTGLDPDSVTAPTPTTVVLTFKAPEYTNLINYASISVVPEHIWKSVTRSPSQTPRRSAPARTRSGLSRRRLHAQAQPQLLAAGRAQDRNPRLPRL